MSAVLTREEIPEEGGKLKKVPTKLLLTSFVLLFLDLIRSELKQQESFWKEQLEKEKENWKSASEGVEQAQAQFAFQRETFQKTLRNLKV